MRTPKSDRIKLAHTLLIAPMGAFLVIGISWVVGITAASIVVFGSDQSTPDRVIRDFELALTTSRPVLIATMIATSSSLIAVALAAPLLVRARVGESLGLKKAPWPTFVAVGFGVMGLSPLGDLLMRLVAELAPNWTLGNMEIITDLIRGLPVAAAFVLVAVLPSFSEELFFRGMLQRGLGRGLVAALVAGLAFSGFHMDPHHVAGVLPIGLYLSWVAYRTESTWVPIAGHLFNNSLALVQVHLTSTPLDSATDTPIPWWLPVVGVAITAIASAVIVWATRRSRLAEPDIAST